MTTATPDLEQVHDRLKAILAPYRDLLNVAQDGPGGMTLELKEYAGKPWGYAAGVRLGKRYVSYYLMGVYGDDRLAASISPELKRRMQGKSCFNFTKIDEVLFRELEALTASSIARQPAITEAMLRVRPRRTATDERPGPATGHSGLSSGRAGSSGRRSSGYPRAGA